MINLLPPKRLLDMRIARSNTVLRRYIELVVFSILIIFVALAAAYYLLSRQQQSVKSTLETNQQKVAELEPVQKDAEELSATVNTISGLLSSNVKFSEMLTKIGGTMPAGTVLTGLQFSIENTNAPFVISAEVESEERAAVLRNNLLASGLFKSVDIKTISLIEEEGEAAQPGTEAAPAAPARTYRYTTTIDTYLKDVGGER